MGNEILNFWPDQNCFWDGYKNQSWDIKINFIIYFIIIISSSSSEIIREYGMEIIWV